jgi:hypothetical protein
MPLSTGEARRSKPKRNGRSDLPSLDFSQPDNAPLFICFASTLPDFFVVEEVVGFPAALQFQLESAKVSRRPVADCG